MSQDIEIMKNIPLPPTRLERQERVPVGDLEVGWSFEVDKKRRGSLSAAITRFQDAHVGVRFTTRVIGDKIRVWRIS